MAVVIEPLPEKGSQVLDGEEVPVPRRVLTPTPGMAPVPTREVTLTDELLHSNDIVPW